MLIDYNPDALSTFDIDGYLPFHLCCQSPANLEVVEHMVSKLDDSTTMPFTKAGDPPLFLASRTAADLDVIYCLVKHSLELFERSSVSS